MSKNNTGKNADLDTDVQTVCGFTGLSKSAVQRLGEFNDAKSCANSHKFFAIHKVMPCVACRYVKMIDKLLNCDDFLTTLQHVADYIDNAQKVIKLCEALDELNAELDVRKTAIPQSTDVDFDDEKWFIQRLADKLAQQESDGADDRWGDIFERHAHAEDELLTAVKERDVQLYYAQESFIDNIMSIAEETA